MKIETITGKVRDGFTTMMAKIEDQVVIEVEGFGGPEYRWRAVAQIEAPENLNQTDIDDALDKAMGPKDSDGYYGVASFGVAACYWEPKTFAHAVWDVIENQ